MAKIEDLLREVHPDDTNEMFGDPGGESQGQIGPHTYSIEVSMDEVFLRGRGWLVHVPEAPSKQPCVRVWAYVRDERPWSGQSPPCAWYKFTINRKGEHPENHLSGFKGWVHVDGYSGFNGIFGDNKASEMACMAHVRRKFVDVFASQGSSIAEEAIKRIALLYAVEKEARGMSPEERVALRQSKAKPVFDDLEAWLHAQLPRISGKFPLAQAIRYTLGRMPKALGYLDHGFLELDNNATERAMRPIALGRKNYLFMGSQRGGMRPFINRFPLIPANSAFTAPTITVAHSGRAAIEPIAIGRNGLRAMSKTLQEIVLRMRR